LQKVDAQSSSFLRAILSEVDFRDANLSGAKFGAADLARAKFGGARMLAADLRGANLDGARELTMEQLSQALTDRTTVLPNGRRGPYMRYSGAEKPRIREDATERRRPPQED
jgi:hypothetical protein